VSDDPSIGWGARFYMIDLVIYAFKKIISKLGFKHWCRSGYTLVLRKGPAPSENIL